MKSQNSTKKIIILYCVSGYPTPEDDSNVSAIENYKKRYKNYLIGISDHTNDINSSLGCCCSRSKNN